MCLQPFLNSLYFQRVPEVTLSPLCAHFLPHCPKHDSLSQQVTMYPKICYLTSALGKTKNHETQCLLSRLRSLLGETGSTCEGGKLLQNFPAWQIPCSRTDSNSVSRFMHQYSTSACKEEDHERKCLVLWSLMCPSQTQVEAISFMLENLTHQPNIVLHAWNPSTWNSEAGGSGIQGQSLPTWDSKSTSDFLPCLDARLLYLSSPF